MIIFSRLDALYPVKVANYVNIEKKKCQMTGYIDIALSDLVYSCYQLLFLNILHCFIYLLSNTSETNSRKTIKYSVHYEVHEECHIFLYSVILTEYVAMESRVCVCVCVCVYVCVCVTALHPNG